MTTGAEADVIIAIASTSPRAGSRSKIVATRSSRLIDALGGRSDFLDVGAVGGSAPGAKVELGHLLARFAQADAFILAFGIENGAAASYAWAFVRAIVAQHLRPSTPYFIVAAAGSKASALAADGLGASLLHGGAAIQVAPACFEFSGDATSCSEERLRDACRLLVAHARLARTLRVPAGGGR